MIIKIYESKTTGAATFESIKKRIDNTQKKASDMRDVFEDISEDMKDSLRYTFSQANPAKWEKLTAKYRTWKTKHGYPVTIGIMTNALKLAMTDQAKIKIEKQRLVYGLNENVINPYNKKKTRDYAKYFNAKRPILDWSIELVNKNIKKAVKEKILAGWKNV